MHDAVTTFLFTDIEGSTRLWEQEPERMRPALARHDAIVRGAVESHGGRVVKMTGDGVHAAFDDPLDAVRTALDVQEVLGDPSLTEGLQLHVRCGVHAGVSEGRDGDYFGTVVNRAARVMGAAHGGQVLLSAAVAAMLDGRLPAAASLRDMGAIRLRDLSSPERLFQLTHPALRAEFPALRSLEETPNNLPQALSSFIGRERDIAGVRKLLGSHRMVTLVGMGGLGKTRLSLHAAAEALDDFPDGVWLVELGSLQEPHRVLLAVAATLGVRDDNAHGMEEVLARHVRDRRMLVILDNCEHLLESAAAAARLLLSAGAGVRVLATSREPLRLGGESSYVLSGLAVPGPREALVPGAVAQYESVRLFVDRAAAAAPGFDLNAENATSIAAICHRLDGIPLAIELAAARARSLSVTQIAARLKDRFRLLTAGDPTALPRQRTLRATIDWSHELLPDDERLLFRRLAVFSGGWTLEAAEEVCAAGALPGDSIIDVLGRLIEKSLAAFEPSSQRYRMLDTVREYAVERLVESDDAAAMGDRHLAYFVRFAEAAKPELAGPHQREWLARVDAERENVLAAHEWAGRSPRDAAAGLRLVNSMKLYWMNRGLLELGHRVTVEALSREGSPAGDVLRAQGLFHAGQILYFMARHREARGYLEQSLALARELGDERGVVAVLQPLGMAALGDGAFDVARRCFEEAVTLSRRRGDKRSMAGALNALALFHRVEGHPELAKPLYEQVTQWLREAGDAESEAIGIVNLAIVAVMQGAPEEARQHLLRALAAAEKLGSRRLCQSVLEVGAALAVARREWSCAAMLFGAAEAGAATSGLRPDPADARFLAEQRTSAQRALGPEPYNAQEALGRELPFAAAMDRLREWAGAAAAAGPVSPPVTSH